MVATSHMYLRNRCRKQLIKGVIVKCLRVLLQTFTSISVTPPTEEFQSVYISQSEASPSTPSKSLEFYLPEEHLFVTSVRLCIRDKGPGRGFSQRECHFLIGCGNQGCLKLFVTAPFSPKNGLKPRLLCPDIELLSCE